MTKKKMSAQMKSFWKQQIAEEEEYIKNMRDSFKENSNAVDQLIGVSVPGGAESLVNMLDDMLIGKKTTVISFVEDDDEKEEDE